jgi:hypothetical protein
MDWVLVYDLREETDLVRQIQEATLNTEEFGLKPEHGLFGSEQWWQAVSSGLIPSICVSGKINRIFMSGMGDWPEVEINADGEVSRWTRYGDDNLYEVGRPIEVNYVCQKWRTDRNKDVLGEFSKNVLTMRIGIPSVEK